MYRILIVEDDFALAEAIRRQLESWARKHCVYRISRILFQRSQNMRPISYSLT